MELRFLSYRIPYEPRINPHPFFVKVVKKAFCKTKVAKIVLFERYGMVEDMPEIEYWDEADAHENGLCNPCPWHFLFHLKKKKK